MTHFTDKEMDAVKTGTEHAGPGLLWCLPVPSQGPTMGAPFSQVPL
jgi:hypothetical protein